MKRRRVDAFRYLGSTVSDATEEREILGRIQASWGCWRRVSEVVVTKMRVKLKRKVYKAVLRAAVIYGEAALPVKNVNEKKLEEAGC